jgi:hypothetical protein
MKFRPSVWSVEFVKRTLCLYSCLCYLPFSVISTHFAASHNLFDPWVAGYFRLFKRRSSALQNVCTINKFILYGLLKNALHKNAFGEYVISLQITATPVAVDLEAYSRRVRCSSLVITLCPDGRDTGKDAPSLCGFCYSFRDKTERLLDYATTNSFQILPS